MTTSGQSIADRALAAKHTVAGQSLAKSVCKATTEEIMAPKRKHLDYLLHCTNEPNVSIPQLANLLIERTQNSSWVVVFKALVTVHNMMHFGNERFSQFLASSNCTFHLDSFYDRGNGMQGYGMSTYIRRYAKYLNQKAYSYRQMAFDFCRAKRGKEDGTFRSMNTEQLLKALPLLQTQFDALIEFEVTAGQMVNGIISAAFMLLFRDLIRLYACYNDGIINLLGRYFDMSKKNCREAFEIYKLFIARVDKVAQFLKVAENIGVDKGEIPDLAKAPSSLIEALEQHLLTLENPKKASAVGAGLSVNSGGHSVVEAPRVSLTVASVNAANVNSSLGMSLPASVPASGPVSISDADRRRILEEEAKMLEAIKQQSLKQPVPPARPAPPAASPAAVTPTYGAPLQSPQPFTSPLGPVATARTEFNPFDQIDAGFDLPPVPPSYDLFGLDQPGPTRTAPSGNGMPFTGDNGLLFPAASFLNPSPVMNASAKTDHNDLFGGQFSSGFNVSPNQLSPAPLVQTHLMPTNLTNPSAFRASSPSSPLGMTDGPKAPSAADKSQKLITGNLDASLATIAGNLSIGTSEQYKRMDYSWNGTTEKRMTGAAVAGSAWGQGSSSPPVRPANTRPLSLNMTGMQPLMMAAGSQYPPVMTGYPAAMTQPMMMMGSTGGPMPTSQGPVLFASQPVISAPPAAAPLLPNDPFGAL